MMALPDELMSEIGPILDSVAAQVSRRYYQYGGTQDELVGEAWLWVCEHPKKLIVWGDPDLEPHGMKKLARAMHNHLRAYGETLKAQHLGYSVDDLAFFSKAMVRELLPKFFDEEAWIYPEQGEEGRRSAGDPSAGNNWVATLADISQAFDRLDASDRDLLARFHRDGTSNNDLADACGVSKQTMSDWHDRAIKRLVDLLGGPRVRQEHDADCEHGYRSWGGRHAVSNSHARAIQSSYYEED